MSSYALRAANAPLRKSWSFTAIRRIHESMTCWHRNYGATSLLRGDIPAPEDFDSTKKTLCILEDLNYLNMGKEQKGRLERLFGYASTHKNVSCMLTAQDPFRILPTVRRCTNLFVLWNNSDGDMLRVLARKMSLPSDTLQTILQHQCSGAHDSLWLDFTANTPAQIRKNGYELVSV